MRVKDLMHHGAECVEDDTPLCNVASIMQEKDVGAVAVSSLGALVGIVTDRDLALRCLGEGLDPGATLVRDVMTAAPVCCGPDDGVDDAAELMARMRVRRLPVVDDGELVGVLSLADLCGRAPPHVAVSVLRAVSNHHAHERRREDSTVV